MTIAAEGIKLHQGNFKAVGDILAPLLEGGQAYRLMLKPWHEKRSIPKIPFPTCGTPRSANT